MSRKSKDINWGVPDSPSTWEEVQVALLMDIRDELKAIRRLGECYRIPRALDAAVEAAKATKRIDKRLAKKVPLK